MSNDIIATNVPHGPDEVRNKKFICRPNELVQFKIKTLEISQIANDILTIQFMTTESQKRYFYDLRFIKHFVTINKWFTTNHPIMEVTFDARKIRPIGTYSNEHELTPFDYDGLEIRVQCLSE